MLDIALFGAPGAGKGTQSKMLIERYNLTYISTGDILRNEIKEGTDIGKEVKDIIEKGGLASDEIIVRIIEKIIAHENNSNGILFDGFPRTVVQAYILDGMLMRLNRKLLCMINLVVPREELVRRMLDRAKLSGRADDNEEVIKNRLREYDNKTVPVAEYYREKEVCEEINGSDSIEEIFNNISNTIDRKLENIWRNIVIFGAPGAGKGTQSKLIAEKYGLVYISTGDLIRREIERDTERGRICKPLIESAMIVPDQIAIELIEEKIAENSDAKGFIFKGFPSTLVQAYILDGLLQKKHAAVTCCIELVSSSIQCVKRLYGRGQTDKARLYDQSTDLIIQRLEGYELRSPKIAEYYQKQGKFYSVNGEQDKKQVFEDVCKTINEAFLNYRLN